MSTLTNAEFEIFINATSGTDSQILRRIESLPASADAKAVLGDLLKLGTRVGDTVLRIGRKIVDFSLLVLRQFPHLGFAAVMALVVGALLSMVPIVGTLLGGPLAALALALGVAWGAWRELGTPDLDVRVREFAAEFGKISHG